MVQAQLGGYSVTGDEEGESIKSLLSSWDITPDQLDPDGVLLSNGIDPADVMAQRQSTADVSRWHVLLLHNPQSHGLDVMLELRNPFARDVEMFSFLNGTLSERHRAGMRLPFDIRPIDRRYPVFPIHLPAEETTVLLLMSNRDSTLVDERLGDRTYLWNARHYGEGAYSFDMVYWCFFGALLSMIVYHAVGGVLRHERIYLFYTGFCAAYLIMQFSASGFAFELIWPKFPMLNIYVPLATLALLTTVLAHFTLAFLDPRARYLGLRRIIWAMTGMGVLIVMLIVSGIFAIGSPVTVYAVAIVIAMIAVVFVGAPVIALFEWRRGNPRGRQFTFTWGLFLAAQSIGILNMLGLVHSSVNPALMSMSGALLSLGLISGYMGDRANRARLKQQLSAALMEKNRELEVEVRERKAAEEHARHLANHDTLTGLPTLRLARERLRQSIAVAQRSEHRTAVLFIDLDGFKAVNDTFGHEVGDQLLQQVATRMGERMRDSDTVARIGGDEFLIVQTEIKDEAALSQVAEKLLAVIGQPYMIDGHTMTVGASIGIALCPDDGTDMGELVKLADAAMYRIKRAGKNDFGFVSAAGSLSG